MRENHFGEAVASRHDEDTSDLAAPEAVKPVVDFPAHFAGWAGWREPFTATSESHVSVWTRVAEDAAAV